MGIHSSPHRSSSLAPLPAYLFPIAVAGSTGMTAFYPKHRRHCRCPRPLAPERFYRSCFSACTCLLLLLIMDPKCWCLLPSTSTTVAVRQKWTAWTIHLHLPSCADRRAISETGISMNFPPFYRAKQDDTDLRSSQVGLTSIWTPLWMWTSQST